MLRTWSTAISSVSIRPPRRISACRTSLSLLCIASRIRSIVRTYFRNTCSKSRMWALQTIRCAHLRVRTKIVPWKFSRWAGQIWLRAPRPTHTRLLRYLKSERASMLQMRHRRSAEVKDTNWSYLVLQNMEKTVHFYRKAGAALSAELAATLRKRTAHT